eukprot:gene1646-3185_t
MSDFVGKPDEVSAEVPEESERGLVDETDGSPADMQAFEQLLSSFRQQQSSTAITSKKQIKPASEFKFWNTQPVLKMTEGSIEGNEPIDANEDVNLVKKDPYAMPAGFDWCSLDINDPLQIGEVYKLLNENYVEDDENMFRFDYSIPFLQWALTPPGFFPDWHVGVRSSKNGKLMALITACPADIRIGDQHKQMAEINFLCVHKKLRSKRLAPVLIKEVTRRVNLEGRWQAVYTAGVVLPKPVNFTRLRARMTMARTIKLYKLPDCLSSSLRVMTEADVSSTALSPIFSDADTRHWLLPRDGVINSFVISDASGVVTDLCSFYHLPSTVIGNPKHDNLKSAYSYYNVATSIPLVDLMRDSLIFARNYGLDVFNALDVMENMSIFEPLKFGIGDGHLQYYIFNWKCAEIPSDKVGLVLL